MNDLLCVMYKLVVTNICAVSGCMELDQMFFSLDEINTYLYLQVDEAQYQIASIENSKMIIVPLHASRWSGSVVGINDLLDPVKS